MITTAKSEVISRYVEYDNGDCIYVVPIHQYTTDIATVVMSMERARAGEILVISRTLVCSGMS